MKIVEKWINYFFRGVGVIANNKIAVIIIFSLGVFLLNKTLCYREEILDYKKDSLSEKVFPKQDTNTNYYYDNTTNDTNILKNIAASDLISCINTKVDLDKLDDSSIKEKIAEINNFFNENEQYFSFLYKDIYTGFTVSYNADAPIFTASTIKAPAMIYLYEQASQGKIDLTEELTYTKNYYSEGSGFLKSQDFNTSYNIDTLINYSIYYSDNAAYAMLMNKYKRENMLEFWQSLGTKYIYTYNTIWGITSANDASIYMQELYNFYLENDEYGNKLMNYFKRADWKMITNKNGEYNTASKGGWSNKSFHDVAIVFEENPYILVIMSNTGEDYNSYTYLFKNASKLIGELHSSYWEYKMRKCDEIKQY